MASFDTINYSLRPNKAIQRQIVFDGLDLIDRAMPLGSAGYIGFGSIWFTDFAMAHRRLGIQEMISIENKPIGAVRGRFNIPFRTVVVEEGDSGVVLQSCVDTGKIATKPWVVWLDYDRPLVPEVIDDLRIIITHAPPNSVLLITMNATPAHYGSGLDGREKFLRETLGTSVSDQLAPADFAKDKLSRTLIDCLQACMIDLAVVLGRSGGFIPAWSIAYKDGAPMITVGGILPALGNRPAINAVLAAPSWSGNPTAEIATPPLTLKEVAVLQSLLPTEVPVTRAQIQALGLDLEEEQLSAYCEHYKRYPAFVQAIT